MSPRGLPTAIALLLLLLLLSDAAPRATPLSPPETPSTSPAGAPGETGTEARQSYSLFLPGSFSPNRKWPILFCFDPARRGALPIELFRDAAERIGMIIVSADGFSSAGSAAQSIEVMAALWESAAVRFPLDLDHVYAAGFSGGGRLCWLLPGCADGIHLAGIVEAGAGLPWPELPKDFDGSDFAFCGLTDETDFNYYEVQRVAGVLRDRSIPHRIVSFEGGHEWPSAAECCSALEWLAVSGMSRGSIPADTTLIGRVYESEMAAGRRNEAEGRLIEARDLFLSVTETFARFRDLSVPRSALRRLDVSSELAALKKARMEESEWASTALDRAVAVLGDATREGDEPLLYSSESLRKEMELDLLLLKAASEDREQRLAARRVLEGIHVRVAVYAPRELTRRGSLTAAAIMLELAVAIEPESADDWYLLARARSRAEKAEGAIEALERAFRLGFTDIESVATDSAFDALRTDPRFRALLAR